MHRQAVDSLLVLGSLSSQILKAILDLLPAHARAPSLFFPFQVSRRSDTYYSFLPTARLQQVRRGPNARQEPPHHSQMVRRVPAHHEADDGPLPAPAREPDDKDVPLAPVA